MLPKQLKSIKNHLLSLQKLDKNQEQLLNEITYIENTLNFNDYVYQEKLFESFAIASTTCPSCGKKI